MVPAVCFANFYSFLIVWRIFFLTTEVLIDFRDSSHRVAGKNSFMLQEQSCQNTVTEAGTELCTGELTDMLYHSGCQFQTLKGCASYHVLSLIVCTIKYTI